MNLEISRKNPRKYICSSAHMLPFLPTGTSWLFRSPTVAWTHRSHCRCPWAWRASSVFMYLLLSSRTSLLASILRDIQILKEYFSMRMTLSPLTPIQPPLNLGSLTSCPGTKDTVVRHWLAHSFTLILIDKLWSRDGVRNIFFWNKVLEYCVWFFC